jgi:23S rRNA-/tRNA-specific pseudouridylate synthase
MSASTDINEPEQNPDPFLSPAPEFPLGPGVRVLARHPAGLLAFEKPAGLAAHPNRPSGEKNTLLRAPYDLETECYRLPGDARLYLLNRLDSPTSGIVLAATNPGLAAVIKTIFREHNGGISKTYYAIAKGGKLAPSAGLWVDRLAREQRAGVVRATRGAGIPAATRYTWLATARHSVGGTLSLLRLEPETGRTHQLRVQCAARSRPILGDKTYGDFPLNRRLGKSDKQFDRLFLHAAAIALVFRWNGTQHEFRVTSLLPPAFAALVPEAATAAAAVPKTNRTPK